MLLSKQEFRVQCTRMQCTLTVTPGNRGGTLRRWRPVPASSLRSRPSRDRCRRATPSVASGSAPGPPSTIILPRGGWPSAAAPTNSVPKWRNWQTRWTQTPVGLTPRAGSTPAFGTIACLVTLLLTRNRWDHLNDTYQGNHGSGRFSGNVVLKAAAGKRRRRPQATAPAGSRGGAAWFARPARVDGYSP